MKFSTTNNAAVATAAFALTTSTLVDAFSVGNLRQQGLSTLPRTTRHQTAAFASTNTFAFNDLPEDGVQQQQQQQKLEQPVDQEVLRLKAMAAKLRQEAAELESAQATERAQALDRTFEKFDANKDGEVSLEELKAALEKTFQLDSIPQDRIQRLMKDLDTSGDGKLQKDEFVSVEQFRSRLEALAAQERQEALAATKAAQEEAEVAKLIEANLELINDKPPTNTDKLVSVLPYLFPLMDGLLFGRYLFEGHESNPLVFALTLLYTAYRSVPFSGFLCFFALNSFSSNLSVNRLVRFNMQQAIFLDIALFLPSLLGTLSLALSSAVGVQVPAVVSELGTDALFVSLLAVLGYATVSSLLGVTPDKVPLLSNEVSKRMPSVDEIQFINPKTGQPFPRNKSNEKSEDEKTD